ncbi:hypothetical protein ABW19_dt0200773 [Dactylella cylindrospora]|nr:hypothetical protein ABW19_dt0200773 [Dactylella cylindrospora]
MADETPMAQPPPALNGGGETREKGIQDNAAHGKEAPITSNAQGGRAGSGPSTRGRGNRQNRNPRGRFQHCDYGRRREHRRSRPRDQFIPSQQHDYSRINPAGSQTVGHDENSNIPGRQLDASSSHTSATNVATRGDDKRQAIAGEGESKGGESKAEGQFDNAKVLENPAKIVEEEKLEFEIDFDRDYESNIAIYCGSSSENSPIFSVNSEILKKHSTWFHDVLGDFTNVSIVLKESPTLVSMMLQYMHVGSFDEMIPEIPATREGLRQQKEKRNPTDELGSARNMRGNGRLIPGADLANRLGLLMFMAQKYGIPNFACLIAEKQKYNYAWVEYRMKLLTDTMNDLHSTINRSEEDLKLIQVHLSCDGFVKYRRDILAQKDAAPSHSNTQALEREPGGTANNTKEGMEPRCQDSVKLDVKALAAADPGKADELVATQLNEYASISTAEATAPMPDAPERSSIESNREQSSADSAGPLAHSTPPRPDETEAEVTGTQIDKNAPTFATSSDPAPALTGNAEGGLCGENDDGIAATLASNDKSSVLTSEALELSKAQPTTIGGVQEMPDDHGEKQKPKDENEIENEEFSGGPVDNDA